MSLAECDDKIYATQNDAIFERSDGEAPAWSKIFVTNIKSSYSVLSGLRGLTCIPNPPGHGESLLVAVEDAPARIYRIDLSARDAGRPKDTLELDVSSFLSDALGTKATYAFVAYNNMTKYPAGARGCPSLLVGLWASTPNARNLRHAALRSVRTFPRSSVRRKLFAAGNCRSSDCSQAMARRGAYLCTVAIPIGSSGHALCRRLRYEFQSGA